ncbi:sigma-70 family RNA polymerase sigma factor [Staphylococcus hyicus]|uniref:sigma-70 family RNA polymerase sigma factor n=1 Tax=Staphylococcus hyicus TaxID=1284 RepID=UPI000580115A|nr:sigma-70 family RNA polymerase sigma factor [Staphylococcus hyicus]AJC96920.1 putative RNA polymerase sigma factor [Staphylococcus hyicus]MCE5153691.1 sigma-70 family RNA polymerase sigma factor [Staphylococcus hyicus]RTX68174.1 sigma-70 family RNA polymerase sigma factor [Staphylococcus hyicus]SQE48870.1 sigma factor SigH [Staphylococcus hyicus]
MTLNPISEVERQQLIKELKAHRPDALRELIAVVRRCAQVVLRDFRITPQDFEDIVQESIWSIYQKVCHPDFHMNIPLEHYINKTLFYKKMDHRRKRVYYQSFISHMIEDVSMQYHQKTYRHHMSLTLNECLEYVKNSAQTLSAFELKVLYYLIDEWVPNEIAQQLNVPVKRVYNAIYRLRRKLHMLKQSE